MSKPARFLISVILGILILAASFGCQEQEVLPTSPPPTPTIEPLMVGLSDDAIPIQEIVLERTISEDLGFQVAFEIGSRQTILEDVQQGQLQAAIIHLPDQAIDLWANPIAMDGLVPVVNHSNPITTTSLSELQLLISGAIDNWNQVGGLDEAVTINLPIPGTGILLVVENLVMAGLPISGSALLFPDIADIPVEVNSDPGSFGLMMAGMVSDSQPLAIEGVLPQRTSLSNQTYPLVVPLYLVALDEPEGQLRSFLSWLQSDEGQAALSEYYGRLR